MAEPAPRQVQTPRAAASWPRAATAPRGPRSRVLAPREAAGVSRLLHLDARYTSCVSQRESSMQVRGWSRCATFHLVAPCDVSGHLVARAARKSLLGLLSAFSFRPYALSRSPRRLPRTLRKREREKGRGRKGEGEALTPGEKREEKKKRKKGEKREERKKKRKRGLFQHSSAARAPQRLFNAAYTHTRSNKEGKAARIARTRALASCVQAHTHAHIHIQRRSPSRYQLSRARTARPRRPSPTCRGCTWS